jgi:hypothetical protein
MRAGGAVAVTGLTSLSLLRSGITVRQATPLAFASDSASITTTDLVGNIFLLMFHASRRRRIRPPATALSLRFPLNGTARPPLASTDVPLTSTSGTFVARGRG